MPIGAAFIGGAFGLFGASKSADASKSAAQLQAQAGQRSADMLSQLGNRSLDFQQQQWGQAQENMMPFMGLGRGAADMLGQRMGITPNYPAQVPMPGQAQGAPGGPSFSALYGGGPGGAQNPRGGDGRTRQGAGAGTNAPLGGVAPGQRQSGQPFFQTQAPPQVQTQAQGQTVHIAWPNGQEADVPAYQAAQYEALGARVVNT